MASAITQALTSQLDRESMASLHPGGCQHDEPFVIDTADQAGLQLTRVGFRLRFCTVCQQGVWWPYDDISDVTAVPPGRTYMA